MTTPIRSWPRRALRAALSVVAMLIAALALLWFTRGIWAERAIERYASRASGKLIDVNGVGIGRAIVLDELIISDPAAPGRPLVRVTQLRAALTLLAGYELALEDVSAAAIELNWTAPGAAQASAAQQGDTGPFGGMRGRPRGGANRFLPYSVSVDALSIDVTTPQGNVRLGPLKISGRLRPSKVMALNITGTPTIHAEGHGLPAPIDGTGTIKISAERKDKVFTANVSAALPGAAAVEAKLTGGPDKGGFSVHADIAQGSIEGPLWPALLSAAAGMPIAFERADIASGGVLQAGFGLAGANFGGLDIAVTVPGLRVGPAEAPLFNAPLNFTLAASDPTGAGAAATLKVGNDITVRATLKSVLPPTFEIAFDKLPVAALSAAVPMAKPLQAALPNLNELSGAALLSPNFLGKTIAADLTVQGKLQGSDSPLKLEAKYGPGAAKKLSATLLLGENSHIKIAPSLIDGSVPVSYTAHFDLAETAALSGLEGWGGTVTLDGSVTPRSPTWPGRVEAKFLNVVSDNFQLPYDVPLTLAAEHALEAKAFGVILKDLVAALPDQAKLRIARLQLTWPAITASAVEFNAQLAFFVAQQFIESGNGTFDFTSDTVALKDGAIVTEGAFKVDAKDIVLPEKLAAAVGLRGEGRLGWANGLQASGELTAEKVLCAGAELNNAKATLRPDGPALLLDGIQGALFGGAAAGTLRIEPFAEGMPATLDARIEGGDLAVFTTQVQPPSVNLTGIVAGDILVGLKGEDFTALNIDLTASSGVTINRALVRELLLTQQMSDATGSKMVGKVLDKIVGGDEQRPFDGAELKLGLQDGRIAGVAVLKSKALNLNVDIKADPGAVWEAIQSRGQVSFGDFTTQ